MTPEERKRDWQKRQRQQDWARRQAQQQQPPQPQGSLLDRFKRNVATGFEQGVEALGGAVDTVSEVGREALRGNFTPALEALELGARGGINTQLALLTGGASLGAAPTVARSQAPAIQQVNVEREARRLAGPDAEYYRGVAAERARLEAEAARDPSLVGKITRGVVSGGVQAIPAIGAGAVSGGSVPVIAGVSALSALGAPETATTAGVLGALPAPAVGKYIAPVLRRIRAGRAAGSVASEAAQGATSNIDFVGAFKGTGKGISDNLKNALRDSVARTGKLPSAEGGSTIGRAYEAAISQGAPRNVATLDAVLQSVEQGAPQIRAATASASRSQSASMRGPAAESANFSLAADDMAAIGKAGEELVTKAERTPVLEIISAARKAGLLTSAKTHIKNVVGTGAFQLSEEAARIPGAVVDMLVSRVTGRRTLTGPSTDSMLRSFQEAATKGWAEAKEVWRKGITQADIERLGLNQEINSGNKILDAYINKTFRSLSVEDKLLNTYATRRALEDRVRAAVLTEIRQGKIGRGDYAKRWKELIDNAPADIQAGAIADGELAVFTNSNRLAKGFEKFKGEQGPGGKLALDVTFPFVKTPVNVLARMLDYSGYGAMKETLKAVRPLINKSMTAEQQRAFAAQWGRAGIGGGLITLGVIGYRNGWLTGFIEDDPGRRERDEAAGRVPGAIKIGNRWHQILGAAPLASLMVIGASMSREVDQEREGSGLLPTLETFGQAVGEQPLLIGSKQIAESLTKPGTTGERFIGGAIGSFVPTALSDIAEAFDPRQRETSGAGILGAAQKRIPGARNLLPEAVDVFGQPRQDFGPGQALLDPTRATADVAAKTPILRELVRLDLGLTGFRKDSGETTADYRRRVQTFGELYQNYGGQLLEDKLYRDASDADRREVVKLLNSRTKHIINEGQVNRAQSLLSASSLFSALRERRERQEKERRARR